MEITRYVLGTMDGQAEDQLTPRLTPGANGRFALKLHLFAANVTFFLLHLV